MNGLLTYEANRTRLDDLRRQAAEHRRLDKAPTRDASD